MDNPYLPPGVTDRMIDEQAQACPDHGLEHRFIPCDEWPATCSCGATENE